MIHFKGRSALNQVLFSLNRMNHHIIVHVLQMNIASVHNSLNTDHDVSVNIKGS